MDEIMASSKVSTIEACVNQIVHEMPQPVGIVLFGADCDLKDEIYMTCVECIPNLAAGYGGKGSMSLRAAKRPFSEERNVLTMMFGNSSGDPKQRCDTVTALRELGAKSVVGLYAKCGLPKTSPDGGYFPKTGAAIIADQVQSLEENPPLEAEFDYLFTKEG